MQSTAADDASTGEPITVVWDAAVPMRPDQRVADQPPGWPIRTQTEALMRMPLDGGPDVAGPTFEWVPVDERG